MNSNSGYSDVHGVVPSSIRRISYDRIELRSSTTPRPASVDRRILSSPGAFRTPRATVRTSPYHNSRSLSPDPSFKPTSIAVELTSCDRSTSSDTRFEDMPTLANSQPRIISTRSASFGVEKTAAQDGLGDESDSDDKIAKPSGEVGKPSRGGYNLRIKLGWADDRFDDVEKFINGLIERKLNVLQPFAQQDPSDIKELQDVASRKIFPLVSRVLILYPSGFKKVPVSPRVSWLLGH
ncbi:hypothetical protein F5051DRAFT_433192 [Lentinula edodes]|uniref:Uncharacterized protein n=1 Tax=Lentinula lateritia TaxID=40482 RepID=A0A9W9AWS9_9AGAR|nr:hypothetical protein F5051DRAFT_433192 [Lentinula edodes]KAJ4492191.1 hypothetical protein C8J55DRAFT_486094 [Lentinula edodes]